MGEEEKSMADRMGDALAESMGEEPEEKVEPQEEESGAEQQEPAAKVDEKPVELEDSQLEKESEDKEAEDKPEDHLANYKTKLAEAGLKNQAEQGERWYTDRQRLAAEVEELRKFRAEREERDAKLAKTRAEADAVIENAPKDMKSEWGRLREKNGDKWFLNAHEEYLEKLREESPDDFEKLQTKQELAELKASLAAEKAERERLEQDRNRREYVLERDSTLRSLNIDPKEMDQWAEEVDGRYFVELVRAQEKGGNGQDIRVADIVKELHIRKAKQTEALRAEVKKALLEEATGKKKVVKRTNEKPTGTAPRDHKQDLEELKRRMVEGVTESASGG